MNPMVGDENNNTLYGSNWDDVLDGKGGDDLLFGSGGNDVLIGGAGNDSLDGGTQNDTYVFRRGDGHDVILSQDRTPGKADVLQFGAGIAPADLELSRVADALYLQVRGTGDRVVVEQFFTPDLYAGQGPVFPGAIDQIRFADGMRWDRAAILGQVALDAGPLKQLDDKDHNTWVDMNTAGGAGSDWLTGGSGAHLLSGGAGDDRLESTGGDSVLDGGSGNDKLVGAFGDDVLTGGAGNDVLDGGSGHNTFVFHRGFGQDTFHLPYSGGPYSESLVFRDVLAGALAFARSGGGSGPDLVLSVKGTDDVLTVPGFFNAYLADDAFRMSFADGTVYNMIDIMNRLGGPPGLTLVGTPGDDHLEGGSGDDLLVGGNGSDILIGQGGSDVLSGGAGVDWLMDSGNGNTLMPGAGDASIDVRGNKDMIVVGRDAGQVHFNNQSTWRDDVSMIVLTDGIAPSEVRVERMASNMLLLKIAPAVQIYLPYDEAMARADADVYFSNGTVWTSSALLDQTLAGSEAGDTIFGYEERGDTIDARGGDDTVHGRGGDDTVMGGSGRDFLTGDAGNDQLFGGDDEDRLDGGDGDDTLYGGDGNDEFMPSNGNDILSGGRGDDLFHAYGSWGIAGTQVLRFNAGDGHDVLAEQGTRSQNASTVLRFGPDIAPADVKLKVEVRWEGTWLLVDIRDGADSVQIPQFLGNAPGTFDYEYRIQAIEFSDGTVWNASSLMTRAMTGGNGDDTLTGTDRNDVMDGGGGRDTLIGGIGNDTLHGGTGDDMLDGGAGEDVYTFHMGDGVDRLTEDGYSASVIRFGAGITARDLSASYVGESWYADLVIQYGSTDKLIVTQGRGVERIEFADGTSTTVKALFQHAPVLAQPLPDYLATGGKPYTIVVPADTFADQDAGDHLSYSATLADGSALPAWLQFSGDPSAPAFQVAPGNRDAGSYAVRLTATDSTGRSVADTFQLTVEPGQSAPVVKTPSAGATLAEGAALNLQAPVFEDPDQGDALSVAVTLADGGLLPGWMHYDAGTGKLSGTAGYYDSGSYALKATATDTTGLRAESAFAVVVTDTNRAPVLREPMPDKTAEAGKSFVAQYSLSGFGDDYDDVISYSAVQADGKALPAWLSFNAASRAFSGTPGIGDAGSFDVLVTGTDKGGLSASDTFHLAVTGVNTAPTLKWSALDLTVAEMSSFTMRVPTFQDANYGDVLSVVVTRADGSALPASMVFDAATGWLGGVLGYNDAGVYLLKATATDLGGLSASSNFAITVTDVNRAPTVAAAASDVHIAEGMALSAPVAAFADPDGGHLVLGATLASGAALPTWMVFDAASGRITGNAGMYSSGSYAVKATATDAGGMSVSSSFTIVIDNTNQAPVVSSAMADASATAGTAFNAALPAQAFSDGDGDALAYSARLAGGALPAWLHFDAASRVFSGTPDHADAGVLDVVVTATDTGGASASDTFRLVVADVNVAPTVLAPADGATIAEGGALSLAVPRFEDANPGDTLVTTLTRADGSALPAWMLYNAASGTVSGTPGFADSGSYALRATATDQGGLSVSSDFKVFVTDVNRAPLVSKAVPDISGVSDEMFGLSIGSTPVFTDPDGGAVTLSASLAGGAALPAWIVFNPAGRGSFSFFPTAAQVGAHDIVLTGTDAGGLATSDTFRVTIDQNLAPTVTRAVPDATLAEGAYLALNLATFADPNQFDALAITLARADGSALPSWMQYYANDNVLAGSSGYADAGSYALKMTATDLGGLTVSSSFTVLVTNTNRAPVVANVPAVQSATEGTLFSYTLPASTFTDPDAGDTGSYSVSQLPAWLAFNAQTRTFSGTPAYADIGHSLPRITYTDAGGLSVSAAMSLGVAQAAPRTVNGTAGDDVLTGLSNNDTLNGLGGNDKLDGGLGADTMAGGMGNDSYVVDNAGDVVTEASGAGTDTVSAAIGYTLGANVENLVLTGTASIVGTGNALSNVLTGNAGANVLDGGAGADTLQGGAGHDTYVIDTLGDVLVEAAGSGTDQVMSALTKTLDANFEVLTLTGTNAVNGYGNADGNLVKGNANANTLNGNGGIDILQGGDGADTLLDSSGTANVFDGGAGADRLTGGTGRDLFIGGAGNDTIDTSTGADIIAFNKGGGQDIVNASSGIDNVLSLGGGIVYANLALLKSGNDLILSLGGTDQITFKGWYLSAANHNVARLQVVTAGGDYVAGSASAITNNKVEQFDFAGLAAKFDQVRSGSTPWNMASSMAAFSSGGSDTAAYGGDLAYHYAVDGKLAALGTTAALAVAGDAAFGTGVQALLVGSALVDGTPLLY